LTGRNDINVQKDRFENVKNNSDLFVNNVIQQMFGYFNRRENLSSLVSILRNLKL